MNTETTEERKGWIFFDRDCALCQRLARLLRPVFVPRGFRFAPLQSEQARRRLHIPPEKLLEEMRLLTPEGQLFGGADAIIELAGRVWWLRPLAYAGHFESSRRVFSSLYRWVARHRTCRAGAGPKMPFDAWLPLVALPSVASGLRPFLAPWVFMWTMAAAIFFGCKWLTFRRSALCGQGGWRPAAYLFLWPGMDPRPWMASGAVRSHGSEWTAATTKLLFGLVLVWGGARCLPTAYLGAWVAMIGLLFVLHFGSFHLLALLWNAVGVPVRPLMRNPARATSLTDFWGRRWNRGFSDLANEYVFRPFGRHVAAGTLAVFLVSGLIHELVISVPAAGGYGLPTFYFVLQGAGILAERSIAGRRIGLGSGLGGRIFVLLITAGPVLILFHPPFVKRVIVPFLQAIQAL